MGFVDKVKNVVGGEKDASGKLGGIAGKAEDMLEAGIDKVDSATGGKHSDKLDKARDVVDKIDKTDNAEASTEEE